MTNLTKLSKKLTEIYLEKNLHGYEHLNEAIDNLENELVVVTCAEGVEVYSSLDSAIENVLYLQDEENLEALEEDGCIDMDDLNIKITK